MVLVRPCIPLLRVFVLIASVLAVPGNRLLTSSSTDAPLGTLDYDEFQSAGDAESFLGIPFAQPS